MKFEKRQQNATSIVEIIERNTGVPADDFLKDVRFPYIEHIQEAAEFIKSYLKENPLAPVTVVGDYDSDGINATAIMYGALTLFGVTPITRLPRRFTEGYGLSEKIISEIPAGLLITVDNGIASYSAIQMAKEKGLSVIVTDHHLPPVDENGEVILPPADVIVDPHVGCSSEYAEYCGAAIAYSLAKILLPEKHLNKLLVLASIATVTDVMPLTGANRTLVKDGLSALNNGVAVSGLKHLITELQLENITEDDYGFVIGPIFNAAGRLYDNGAEKVLKLLTSDPSDPKNPYRAKLLIEKNEKRKELVKESMLVANKLVDGQRPIVIYHHSFGEGIIGIIAGQLAEKYNCPAIVFTQSKDDNVLKGSGRSIPGIHLKDALNKIQDKILRYGGHAGAAGLSIEKNNLSAFRNAFCDAVGKLPPSSGVLYYDLDLNHLLIPEVIKEVKKYSPYGEGNPKILFRMRYNANGSYKTIGDGSHFMIKDDNLTIMGFGLTEKYERLGKPVKLDCVGHLTEDTYHGETSVKFELIDFNPLTD